MRTSLDAEQLKNDIVARIEELSGENVYACYQCGRCSAGCPGIEAMDLLPNQVIRLLQMGQVDEVLRCKDLPQAALVSGFRKLTS